MVYVLNSNVQSEKNNIASVVFPKHKSAYPNHNSNAKYVLHWKFNCTIITK